MSESEEVTQENAPVEEVVPTEVVEDVEAPAQDQPVADEPKKHPLEPGGDRFKQVVARSHKAERERDELRAELQREREERIRLEERSKVQQTQQEQQEKSWAELERGIDEGRWTRDQAHEYKEKMTRQRLEREFEAKFHQKNEDAKVLGQIGRYQETVPGVMEASSENRIRYEQEYRYLISLGDPANYKTELKALRAAFGDPETAKSRFSKSKPVLNKEPLMETHSSQSQPKKPTTSFKDTLPESRKIALEKLIRGGIYKDWAEVEKMETWTPKVVRTGRR